MEHEWRMEIVTTVLKGHKVASDLTTDHELSSYWQSSHLSQKTLPRTPMEDSCITMSIVCTCVCVYTCVCVWVCVCVCVHAQNTKRQF